LRLQGKLLLLLIPLVATALVAIGSAAYVQLRANLEDNHRHQIEILVDQITRQVQAKIRTAEANASLFASGYLLQEYALTDDEHERYRLLHRPLMRAFAGYQNAYPDYYELRFVLPDGYEAARRVVGTLPNQSDIEYDTALLEALAQARDRAHSQVAINPDNGELALYVGRAIRLRDSSVDPVVAEPLLRGYLIVTVRFSQLQRLLASRLLGSEGRLFVSDDNGRLLLGDGAAADSGSEAEHHHYVFSTADRQTLRDQLMRSNRVTLAWLDGAAYVHGRELSPGLYLYGALPNTVVASATARLRDTVVVVTLLTIAAFTVVLFAALRRLVLHPLRRLESLAHRIGHGHLDVTAPSSGKDEVASLARSFTRMAENLAASNAQVRFLAEHDSLTGLPNRHLFQDYLEKALAHAQRQRENLVMLFLDVDEFKNVNDTLGHQAGDILLREFAERLLGVVRAQDMVARRQSTPREMVARLGGDEFTILLPGVKEPTDAATVAQRIFQCLEAPFSIDQQQFFVGASIGVTVFPHDGETAADLIKHADLAMYHAKRSGKNNYQFFAPAMNETALRRMQMETRLRRALDNREFALFLQPIVDLAHGGIVSAEALIRWHDTETGQMVMPDEFIPVAESSGLILPIGEWVLEEACRISLRLQDRGLPALRIGVNASALQIENGQLVSRIEQVLRDTGLQPQRLELELTETVIMSAARSVQGDLERLRAMGVSLALDDFGVGYSSLSYLRHFAIDKLKIDRRFVHGCVDDESQRSIVEAIIALAHALGYRVVGEGIEDTRERNFLAARGCDLGQGFLFYRPMPAERFEALVTLSGAMPRRQAHGS
jgi:diguanylate cyclase (GGDEF)-like protein